MASPPPDSRGPPPPPVPPKPAMPSYASKASKPSSSSTSASPSSSPSVPARPPKPKSDAPTMAPISSTSFYSDAAVPQPKVNLFDSIPSDSVASTSTSAAALHPTAAGPKKAKVTKAPVARVREDYIDIDADDEQLPEEERGLGSEIERPTVPRGRYTTPFMPRANSFSSSSASNETRGRPPRAPQASQIYIRKRPVSPTLPRNIAPHVPAYSPSEDFSQGGVPPVHLGPAGVAPRIVARAGDIDPGDPGGIWPNSTYDVKIDFAAFESTQPGKYEPLGTWVETSASKAKRKAKRAPEDVTMADQALSPSISSTAPQDPPQSSETPSAESLPPPEGFYTISRAELEAAKPHPSAYYCSHTHRWALFHQLPNDDWKRFSEWGVEHSDVEIWRPARALQGPIEPQPDPPLPPAHPEELDSSSLETSPLPLLRVLEGSNGGQVAYSSLDWYPTVVPRALWKTFTTALHSHPLPSDPSANHSLASGIIVFIRAIEGILFKGVDKAIPITGKVMAKRFNSFAGPSAAKTILTSVLGFREEEEPWVDASESGSPTQSRRMCLLAPSIRADTPKGAEARQRLLRAWLEFSLFVECLVMRDPDLRSTTSITAKVQLELSAPALLKALGGDLPRKKQFAEWKTAGGTGTQQVDVTREANLALGLVPDLADEIVAKVYHAQKTFTPQMVPTYLGALLSIATARNSTDLEMLVQQEKSLGLFTDEDLCEAYNSIGAGLLGHTLDDDHLIECFVQRQGEIKDAGRLTVLRKAFELIAQARESELLKGVLLSLMEEEKPKMTTARAYELLGGPEETDEDMLVTLYQIRLEDSPGQADLLKEALGVVAEQRKSRMLLNYIKTGSVVEDIAVAAPSGRPVGLTNIANTCYLNSLLQYFFTVRELRETILGFTGAVEVPEGDQLNRVGGRLVTRAEVERSRRFVILLQGLFSQLIHAPTSSVTPETELAYLALVPSKEETDAKEKSVGTAAKAASPPVEVLDLEAGAKSPSVLGKRGSDALEDDAANLPDVDRMMIDSQHSSEPSPAPTDITTTIEQSPASSPLDSKASEVDELAIDPFLTRPRELSAREGADGVIEIGTPPETMVDVRMTMLPPLPPALPPRPEKKADLGQDLSSYMAFGRQNDVTECMDNVMFQVECALNPASHDDASSSETAGLLKKTFYGKMKQQLKFDNGVTDPLRIQEEPFFSLLVDVAEEGRDVYDGLDTVFDNSLVEIDGHQAQRQITLVDVPPILQIQLQRVQYNRTEKKIFKSNAHMSFESTISMDRYLELDDGDLQGLSRREQTNELRRQMDVARTRLQELQHTNDSNVAANLRSTHAYFSDNLGDKIDLSGFSHNIDDDLDIIEVETDAFDPLGSLLAEAGDVEREVSDLMTEITSLRYKIKAVWEGEQKAEYELVAVFIHRGTALSGHYYIYIRDSEDTSKWLKYNDSFVTDVDASSEIFGVKTGDTNPYFLVYARKDRLDALDTSARKHQH